MPLKPDAPKIPKLVHPLTDIQIRNAKPKDKPYKLTDGGGLYVEVMPIGSKLWRKSLNFTDSYYPTFMLKPHNYLI